MKTLPLTMTFAIASVSFAIGQADSTSSAKLKDFGHQFFESIVKKDPALLFPLLYTKSDLMETIRNNVRNEELKGQMLEDIDIPGFDEKILAECRSRHTNLLTAPGIEWEKIVFEDFRFVLDTLQSEQYDIEVGQGFLYFSYGTNIYKIIVDKMAHLSAGWRGHEFGSGCLKAEGELRLR
jgi:hypothetical protein